MYLYTSPQRVDNRGSLPLAKRGWKGGEEVSGVLKPGVRESPGGGVVVQLRVPRFAEVAVMWVGMSG